MPLSALASTAGNADLGGIHPRIPQSPLVTQESAVVFGRVPLRRHHGVRLHSFSIGSFSSFYRRASFDFPRCARSLSLSRVRLRSARVARFLSLSFVLRRPETRRREILMDITDFEDDARAGIKMVPVLRR